MSDWAICHVHAFEDEGKEEYEEEEEQEENEEVDEKTNEEIVFWDAPTELYKLECPSVCWSIRP